MRLLVVLEMMTSTHRYIRSPIVHRRAIDRDMAVSRAGQCYPWHIEAAERD